MRRRLVKLVLFAVALPLAVEGAEKVADRLEAQRGPSASTRMLRQGAAAGRRLRHR